MTKADFIWICKEHAIDPSIAFENEKVRSLLKSDANKGTVHAQLKLNTILTLNF